MTILAKFALSMFVFPTIWTNSCFLLSLPLFCFETIYTNFSLSPI